MLRHKNNKGFTFIEVMLALGISTVLIAGAAGTYIVQNRSFTAQESVSEVNTQSKVGLDLIANDLKNAGFGAPSNMDQDPINGFTDILTHTDKTYESDSITVVGGFRMIGTLWPAGGSPGMACPATITLGTTDIKIIYSGTERPDMNTKRYITIDGVNFAEIASCTLSAGNCDENTITLDRQLSQNFPMQDTNDDGQCDTGRPVYLVEDVTYCVDYYYNLRRIRRDKLPETCMGTENSDEATISENIEDLQFAYAVDADDDDDTDDQNSDNTIDGSDFLNGDVITDSSTITAVRINVLAKAAREDPNYNGQDSVPPLIENREHYSSSTTVEKYRRRWWKSIVNIRNQ